MRLANFIDGGYVEPESKQYLNAHQPATGKIYGQVPDSDERDIDKAVAAAQNAFPDWARLPVSQRSALLNRIADVLERRLDEFAEAESLDQGKPISLARAVDIPRAVANFRFFAGAILYHQETSTDMDGAALNYTHRKPLGVAGLISPWNLPLYLLTWKIAPAIAVGNCAVAKPSELTSLTAHMLGDVFQEAGLPAGVCNIVLGLGAKAGAALVRHPHTPLISFTGGTETGIRIQKDAAPHLKKLSLELGGKNANIIFEDADLADCAPTSVRAAFTNQGEVCLCGSRILVQSTIYDRFLQKFLDGVKALTVGDPRSPTTNMGALVSADHLAKVRAYIDLAREEGGTVLIGGDRPNLGGELASGYFATPTVIAGLAPNCRVMQEEIFGPVVTVTPFETEEEAVAIANGTRFGLSATIWTANLKRAHRVGQAMDAGIIWINTWMLRDLRTPFGGFKASGLGREGGSHSIDFYTESQNICIQY